MEDLLGKMQELLSDPESMQQISELAQMLRNETDDISPSSSPSSGSEDTCGSSDSGFPFDPMLLLKLGELWQNSQKQDENTALLLALRPHLRSERREKVDRAVKLLQIMTIWNTLKESGMLQNLL